MKPDFTPVKNLILALGGTLADVLYSYAKSQIGQIKSGIEASEEYGCAEAVNRIFSECFGNEIGGGASTALLYNVLKSDPRFVTDITAQLGDIIISPTGMGNAVIPNGHVGIVSDNGNIMSNNSSNGHWDEHFNLASWKLRYATTGGYPIYYFRITKI